PPTPGQVDRCNHVPVHHYTTFSAPELSSDSLVLLESLPALRTCNTRTPSLLPAQTDDWQASPASFVFQLTLGFTEAPPVHPSPILGSLTVTLTIEPPDPFDVLKNDDLPLFKRFSHYPLRRVVKQVL